MRSSVGGNGTAMGLSDQLGAEAYSDLAAGVGSIASQEKFGFVRCLPVFDD